MNKIKRSFALILTLLALIVLLAVAVNAHSFTDVHEYDEAIGMLSDLGVIRGYSSTVFRPNEKVSRWQFALMVSKLVTANVETSYWEGSGSSAVFSDVNSWSVYPAAIEYAAEKGIVIGRGGGIFDPSAGISVQEGFTMAVRALGYPRGDYDGGYPESYMAKSLELGLTDGIETYDLTRQLTRGETAQLLNNALNAICHDGSAIASRVFDIYNGKIVIIATDSMKLSSSNTLATPGTFKLGKLSGFGVVTNVFTLSDSVIKQACHYNDPNEMLGVAFNVTSRRNFSEIITLERCSVALNNTASLTITDPEAGRISLGGVLYTTVSSYTRALADNVVPGSKEVIVYSLNDVFASGTSVRADKMRGTNAYYEMTAYDDNYDGFADRAIYTPYSFGVYEADKNTGKYAIAGNNLLGDFTLHNKTGAVISEGDYVLWSFNPQTKVLTLAKKFEVKNGTISSYAYNTDTIRIDGQYYSMGNEALPGAAKSGIMKVFNIGKSVTAYPVEYVLDNGVMISAKLGKYGMAPGGTYYYCDLRVVTETTFDGLYQGVKMNGSEVIYRLASLDGSSGGSSTAQIRVGDVIEVTTATTGDGTGGAVNAVKHNSAPTWSTRTGSAVMSIGEAGITFLEGGMTAFTVPVSANTTIIIMPDNGVTPQASVPADHRTTVTFDGYRSVYVSYGSRSDGKAELVFIRPFDAASLKLTARDFTGVAYISAGAIETGNQTPVSGNALNAYYGYRAADMVTGNPITLVMQTGNRKLSEAGYYPTYKGYILSDTPLTESISGAAYDLHINAEITAAELETMGTYYRFVIGGRTYNVPAAVRRMFALDASGNITDVSSEYSLNQLTGMKVDYIIQPEANTEVTYYGPIWLIIKN
ncbi:MAG: S-layer homology domain-containing protein [Clostridiales bacterium]|nr:S-layer homology domain-containing protein [Clostridiales bacterium]